MYGAGTRGPWVQTEDDCSHPTYVTTRGEGRPRVPLTSFLFDIWLITNVSTFTKILQAKDNDVGVC